MIVQSRVMAGLALLTAFFSGFVGLAGDWRGIARWFDAIVGWPLISTALYCSLRMFSLALLRNV